MDAHRAYPSVIAELKQKGESPASYLCRRSRYMNNLIEQDHRLIKKGIVASRWFRSMEGAVNTIQGYEAMHKFQKDKFAGYRRATTIAQIRFVNRVFGLAT